MLYSTRFTLNPVWNKKSLVGFCVVHIKIISIPLSTISFILEDLTSVAFTTKENKYQIQNESKTQRVLFRTSWWIIVQPMR